MGEEEEGCGCNLQTCPVCCLNLYGSLANYVGSDNIDHLCAADPNLDVFAAVCCVTTVSTLIRTIKEYCKPGQHIKSGASAAFQPTYDQEIAMNQATAQFKDVSRRPVTAFEAVDMKGSPVMKDIFEEKKPMAFILHHEVGHFTTLLIIPSARTIGYCDGLHGTFLGTLIRPARNKTQKSGYRANDLFAEVGKAVAATTNDWRGWRKLSSLGRAKDRSFLQQDDVQLPDDVLYITIRDGDAFQCGIWALVFAQWTVSWITSITGAGGGGGGGGPLPLDDYFHAMQVSEGIVDDNDNFDAVQAQQFIRRRQVHYKEVGATVQVHNC